MAVYRTRAGDVLDELCWRHYGRRAGAVEAVLEANPGLADHGPILPADLRLDLPNLPADRAAPAPVQLWE